LAGDRPRELRESQFLNGVLDVLDEEWFEIIAIAADVARGIGNDAPQPWL